VRPWRGRKGAAWSVGSVEGSNNRSCPPVQGSKPRPVPSVRVCRVPARCPVSEDAHTAQEVVERTKDRLACAADDCALFMYGTVPNLAIAINVLRLRGFRYVTNWTWDKIKTGTGYWNRNRHEHLLLGIKGNIPCPAPGQQWESLLSFKATEHSAKPEQFLKMIEEYFPNLPKIELNRRGPPRSGWSSWGLEAEESTPETD
jgi:N6-adenosine-specific RNA methylase IME4